MLAAKVVLLLLEGRQGIELLVPRPSRHVDLLPVESLHPVQACLLLRFTTPLIGQEITWGAMWITTLANTQAHSSLQPHLYDLTWVYLMMRRRGEPQAIIFQFALPCSLRRYHLTFLLCSIGMTGSGESFSLRLRTSQILRLSTRSKKI
jgi:hypothetical protein